MRKMPGKAKISWTLVRSTPLGAGDNMVVDEALLVHALQRQVPDPMVRVYQWPSPALSVGRHQSLGYEFVAACRLHHIAIVRRPTGGTAVLHKGDVTYCVVGPTRSMGVMETYRWVADGLIAAFDRLGLTAAVAEHLPPSRKSVACFAASMGADLEVEQRKVCGSAQLRRKGWFLQHGSIPVFDERPLTEELLGAEGLQRSTCLKILRPQTTPEEVVEALTEGFEKVWGSYRELLLKGI